MSDVDSLENALAQMVSNINAEIKYKKINPQNHGIQRVIRVPNKQRSDAIP